MNKKHLGMLSVLGIVIAVIAILKTKIKTTIIDYGFVWNPNDEENDE